MSEERLETSSEPTWTRRAQLRAFYSGHSLSEGVPEVVEQIAGSLGHGLQFEVQTLGYSLLRERTHGKDPSASQWSGYRAGSNRHGSGLDVAAELRAPTRLGAGEKYDVLVVTERHDLPAIARDQQSARYLAHITEQLVLGNPAAEVFFYHTWLDLDVEAPLEWVAYERSVRRMWECVASRANLELGQASGPSPRIRVLPGASALAELVAELWEGKVPGVAATTGAERVRMLFADNVHLSDTGRYFLALVHYAVLYGASPEGAVIPKPLAAETARHMQRSAWRHVQAYGRVANAAARRDMAACRSLMESEICPQFAALRATRVPLIGAIKQRLDSRRCASAYNDPADPNNPFRSR